MAQKRHLHRPPLFYTYWLDQATFGLCLARAGNPEVRVVSRVHGYDLYAERRRYFPCRERTLALLDRLFVVSDHGRRYLCQRHVRAAAKIHVSRLGVPDPAALAADSPDGVFRVVSCSRLTGVKRVELLLAGLCELACRRGDQMFEWSHFGGGPLEAELRRRAADSPPNLRIRLMGEQPNAVVLQHYHDEPVDLFAVVSASEGAPVSIMEAQSYGIQVLATSVGGVPELVATAEGLLLSANPTPDEIASGAWALLTDRGRDARRASARMRWLQFFNSESNFSEFADRLFELSEA